MYSTIAREGKRENCDFLYLRSFLLQITEVCRSRATTALLRRIALERGRERRKRLHRDGSLCGRYPATRVHLVRLRKSGNQIHLTYFLGPLSATSGDHGVLQFIWNDVLLRWDSVAFYRSYTNFRGNTARDERAFTSPFSLSLMDSYATS